MQKNENKLMAENTSKEISHHADELESAVHKTAHIPAWVIAKLERSSTDLSDVTHYLDGDPKFAQGGGIVNLDKIKNNIGEVLYKFIGSLNKEQAERMLTDLKAEIEFELKTQSTSARYSRLIDEQNLLLYRLGRDNEMKMAQGGNVAKFSVGDKVVWTYQGWDREAKKDKEVKKYGQIKSVWFNKNEESPLFHYDVIFSDGTNEQSFLDRSDERAKKFFGNDISELSKVGMAQGGGIKKRIVVVWDEGYGKIINNLFNQWNNVRNQSQYNKWVAKVKETKFGTYGTIPFNDVLNNFEFNKSNAIHEVLKKDFLKEVNKALVTFADGGGVGSRFDDNLESLLLQEGWQVKYYDKFVNEVPKEKAVELSVFKFEPYYESVAIKLPSKMKVTFDWVMNKVNKDKVYKSLADTFNKILKSKYGEGINAYPTTYGLGVFAGFGIGISETKAKINDLLDSLGIEYKTEHSEAGYVFRYKISKSKENLDKIKELEKTYGQGGTTPKQQKKIGKVMHEFKEGDLKTSAGTKVTNPKQAVAIALSEAGVPKKGWGHKKSLRK
jgi:hypothetical protein